MTYNSSDTEVIQPDQGNHINIEVEVDFLDRATMFGKAEAKMKTSFSIINQINPQVKNWSAAKEFEIESALEKKRKEIIDFYK